MYMAIVSPNAPRTGQLPVAIQKKCPNVNTLPSDGGVGNLLAAVDAIVVGSPSPRAPVGSSFAAAFGVLSLLIATA